MITKVLEMKLYDENIQHVINRVHSIPNRVWWQVHKDTFEIHIEAIIICFTMHINTCINIARSSSIQTIHRGWNSRRERGITF